MTTARRVGTHILALAMLACAAGAAAAEELRDRPRAVLELFTSQGCSSCPPADAMLEQMAEREDVVALAYHVDYWDYIGWADTFGSEQHSDHQRAYAQSWGSSRIYTPQLVVNGTTGVVASRRHEVDDALAAAQLPLPVQLTFAEGMLEVSIDGQAGLSESMVWLVTFIDSAKVQIERGENAGETISYAQIVTGRHLLGMWEPGTGTHLKLPLGEFMTPSSNGAAVLVQEDDDGLPGPILGAASLLTR